MANSWCALYNAPKLQVQTLLAGAAQAAVALLQTVHSLMRADNALGDVPGPVLCTRSMMSECVPVSVGACVFAAVHVCVCVALCAFNAFRTDLCYDSNLAAKLLLLDVATTGTKRCPCSSQ